MSQNKELKNNLGELQDAFVKLTHQNMELASDLDSERRRLTHLRAQMNPPTPSTPEATPTSTQHSSPSTTSSLVSQPVQTLASLETTPTLDVKVEADGETEGGLDELDEPDRPDELDRPDEPDRPDENRDGEGTREEEKQKQIDVSDLWLQGKGDG